MYWSLQRMLRSHYMQAQVRSAVSRGSLRFIVISICVCGGIAAVQRDVQAQFRQASLTICF
jgi:hypothetical protein